MKTAAFVTVRIDSTRLPDKAVMPILGRPTIEWVILRAKAVKNVDEVVVCTTERPMDDAIAAIAEKCGVQCFRGSLEDKLARWLGAAKKYSIDYFATMDGDDLLCDPYLVERGIEQMGAEECDFIKAPPGLICGSFTYCIRTSALEKVCEIKDTTDTEMMWVYFEDTGLFSVQTLDVTDPVYYSDAIRLTLDYKEDFEFFKTVLEHYKSPDNAVPLKDIVPFLNEHPEIVALNSFRQQDYVSNQKKKIKLVVKKGHGA